MIVAVKCNITNSALEYISPMLWGIKYDDVSLKILENYIESLNCIDNFVPCKNNEVECKESITTFICAMSVLGITSTIVTDEINGTYILFTVDEHIINGKEPYTYDWYYDDSDFDIIGNNTSSTLKLKIKPGKNINDIISSINVEVKDSNKCEATKSCWFTSNGIQCGNAYKACTNTSNLVISELDPFLIEWDNSDILYNNNILNQEVLWRTKGTIPYSNIGFIPNNPLAKNIFQSTIDLPKNIIYEFRVKTNCTLNGPMLNDDGPKEALCFNCLGNQVVTYTATTASFSIDLSNTSISKIEVSLYKSSDDSLVEMKSYINIGNISTTFSNLLPNTDYYISYNLFSIVVGTEISSYSQLGDFCDKVDFTTSSLPPECNPVTNLAANNITFNSMDINWTASPNVTVSGYNVLYKESTSSTWIVAGNTLSTTFNLSGLTPLTTYDIKIECLCDFSLTTMSNIISIRTLSEGLNCGNSSTRVVELDPQTVETWNIGCTPGIVNIAYNIDNIDISQKAMIEVLYNGITLDSRADLSLGDSGTMTFMYNPVPPICNIQLRFTIYEVVTTNFFIVNSANEDSPNTHIDIIEPSIYTIQSGALPVYDGETAEGIITSGTYTFKVYHGSIYYPRTLAISKSSNGGPFTTIQFYTLTSITQSPKILAPITLGVNDSIKFEIN